MRLEDMYPGMPVKYWLSTGDWAHAVIAKVDHANTEDNARPRATLSVLLPSCGRWTVRHCAQYIDADPEVPREGHWSELTFD